MGDVGPLGDHSQGAVFRVEKEREREGETKERREKKKAAMR